MSDFEIISQKLPYRDLKVGEQNIMLIQIRGRLDFNTAPELKKVLDDCFNLGIYKLIVDLGHITYLGSTGLGVLINLRRTLEEHHGHAVFMRPSPRVRTAFGLFEFDPYVSITDNIKTALEELRR